MMLQLLWFITLAVSFVPQHLWSAEESDNLVRCLHGQQGVPIVVSALCSQCTCPTPTGMSVVLSTTTTGLTTSVSATDTVPGPSAAYTTLTISGTLLANQVCTSQVNVADMSTLFMQAGYYTKGQAYNILRSNISIATTLGNELILTSTDGVVGDSFGVSVAMSGNGGSTVVVGAPLHSPGGTTAQGAVYIYQRQLNAWVLIQEIPDPLALNNDSFGAAVAISYDGSTIAVTSGTAVGTVYLYQYNSSSNQYVLAQAIAGIGVKFGRALSVSATGEYVAIANVSSPAQVFVYVRGDSCTSIASTWTLQQTLTGLSFASGVAVSLSADTTTLAFGMPLATFGVVEMFTRSGSLWSLVQTLTATDETSGDGFGSSVALSSNGQYILVGAPFKSASAGEAYEFVLRGTFWDQENIFTSPITGTSFGSSVSLSSDGTVGIIGATTTGARGNAFGVLRCPDNVWTTPFAFSGHTSTARFATSVSLSADGSFAIVGAPDLGGATAGSASIFRPQSATIPTDAIITGSLCVYGNMRVNSDVLVTGSVFVNGTLLSQAVTACLAPSDRCLKKDITPLDSAEALRKLALLEPVTFSWINPEEHTSDGTSPVGFIAQQVKEHFPHLIYRREAQGNDRALLGGQPMCCIGITPEIFAYIVAAMQGVDAESMRNEHVIELLDS